MRRLPLHKAHLFSTSRFTFSNADKIAFILAGYITGAPSRTRKIHEE